jgi:hypothetical protein
VAVFNRGAKEQFTGRHSVKKKTAKPGDDEWTDDKQRCWNLLVRFVGGEHHLANVYHFGSGLRMSTWWDLATFDGGRLTWLVVLAHRDHCRVSIGPSGPGRVAVHVWARKPEGNLFERHPGLNDLVAMAERAKRAEQ